MWREVMNLPPSLPANGESLTRITMVMVGSSIAMTGIASGCSSAAMVSPISMSSTP